LVGKAAAEGGASNPGSITPKIEHHKVIPQFVPQDTDAQLFLGLFESQAGMTGIVPKQWVAHSIGLLPKEMVEVLAREPCDLRHKYSHVKKLI
jgi:hypothetical protein